MLTAVTLVRRRIVSRKFISLGPQASILFHSYAAGNCCAMNKRHIEGPQTSHGRNC
jgi:hypothetical protein